MLCDFSNTGGSEFLDQVVRILELIQDLGENFVLDDVVGQIIGVPGDIGQAGADLSL